MEVILWVNAGVSKLRTLGERKMLEENETKGVCFSIYFILLSEISGAYLIPNTSPLCNNEFDGFRAG